MLFYKVTESKQREYVKEIEERKAAKAAKPQNNSFEKIQEAVTVW